MMKFLAMELLLLSNFLFTIITLASASSNPTAIIIGAGMSGMSAAKTLHDAGITDILILEATNRVGGRLMKTDFNGYTVEKGGNWLFNGGPIVNPLITIADKLNLTRFYSDYSNITANVYKQDGGLYPKEQVEKVYNESGVRDDFSIDLSNALSAQNEDIDVSILASQRMIKRAPKSPLEKVIDFWYNDFEDAEPPKETSLKHTIPRMESVDHGDDEYFVADPRGFEVVVQYIAKQFLSSLTTDPRLKLNQVVRQINYSDSGVTITTEDGNTYTSKYVIVSVSLGVLHTDLIEFTPELPAWKQIAIADFSMTIYTKIFLQFPSTFWPTGPGTEFFLYTHVRRGYYPVFQHLENEYPGANLLMVTVTAEESRRVELLTDEEIMKEVMEILKKLFGDDIPNAESILVPRWGQERFYQGSYSNWPANYNDERHDNLVRPVGPVYFTGEHCSTKYIGYADGAYLSGIDTANDVLGCIKNSTCKGSHHINLKTHHGQAMSSN